MCLDTINKENPRLNGRGYKVLRNGFGEFYMQGEGVRITQGDTIKANNTHLKLQANIQEESYPCGLHVFLTHKDAMRWIDRDNELQIWEVRYWDAHTQGIQVLDEANEFEVVVCSKVKYIKQCA